MKVRVVGLRDGLGNKKYIVQWKTFLFWHTLQSCTVSSMFDVVWEDKEYDSLDHARTEANIHLKEHLAKKRTVDFYYYIGEYK
jgi:hypothetical protein